MPVTVGGRDQLPTSRAQSPVEEHRLDAVVIVEVLQVAQVGHRSGHVGVQVGGAVTRNLEVVGLGHRRRPQPDGVAAAAGDVDLQAVDRAGAHHLGEVIKAVAVLPGGHIGTTAITDLPQPIEVVGGYRLFKPDDVVLARRTAGPSAPPVCAYSHHWRRRTAPRPRR